MSPLAPQMNGDQTFNRGSRNTANMMDAARILAPINPPKVTYSLSDLYEMRHSESHAPNLGNRSVLASISRPSITPPANCTSSFSFNIMSESLDQIQRSRRHQNITNGGHTNNGRANGDRHRQPNRGKEFQTMIKKKNYHNHLRL